MISAFRLARLRYRLIIAAGLLVVGLLAGLVPASQAKAGDTGGYPVAAYSGLSQAQRANLLSVARDTWKFFVGDIDPATNLPMDNQTFAGGSATPTTNGAYTSAADIGVYLWSVVSARDLGLISTPRAAGLIRATLTEVAHLKRYDGFLYQWYDTTNGSVLSNPGDADCAANAAPAFNNCSFVSNVDNGWYASGLIVAREAIPQIAHLADSLIAPMNFGIFCDNREPAHRPDVRRLLRRAAAGPGHQLHRVLPQRRLLQ
jgi:Protein of unknown function (DUF3131)